MTTVARDHPFCLPDAIMRRVRLRVAWDQTVDIVFFSCTCYAVAFDDGEFVPQACHVHLPQFNDEAWRDWCVQMQKGEQSVREDALAWVRERQARIERAHADATLQGLLDDAC